MLLAIAVSACSSPLEPVPLSDHPWSIHGIVRDSDGDVQSDATIILHRFQRTPSWCGFCEVRAAQFETKADANGAFSLKSNLKGEYSILVTRRGSIGCGDSIPLGLLDTQELKVDLLLNDGQWCGVAL
ncbi:carboxypeptidase-like regulatory domain-containing protein [Luteimonas sp. A537]